MYVFLSTYKLFLKSDIMLKISIKKTHLMKRFKMCPTNKGIENL